MFLFHHFNTRNTPYFLLFVVLICSLTRLILCYSVRSVVALKGRLEARALIFGPRHWNPHPIQEQTIESWQESIPRAVYRKTDARYHGKSAMHNAMQHTMQDTVLTRIHLLCTLHCTVDCHQHCRRTATADQQGCFGSTLSSHCAADSKLRIAWQSHRRFQWPYVP